MSFTGAKVYMLGRNADKLAAAQQEVMRATGVSADVIPTRICDLASLQSVRDFAEAFKNGTACKNYIPTF